MTHRQAVAEWCAMYSEKAGAASWLEAHRWTYGPAVAQSIVSDIRRKLELRPEDDVLEVGAGSGAFLMNLLLRNQRGFGLDFCEPLIRERFRFGVDPMRVKLGVAEGAYLPIASESFDKVLCYSVAHHFPDDDYARDMIHQLVRVCRAGGIVLLGDVCGVMERYRKTLVQRGVPPLLVDGVLWAASPVRSMRWMRARRKYPRWCRSYWRCFFERTLKSLPCDFEILDQDIPQRKESLGRFDVRIWKKGLPSRAATHVGLVFWSFIEFVQGALFGWGVVLHG
jgi:SAM-dependent methyltransferase